MNDLQKFLTETIDLLERAVINKSHHDIQSAFDLIDNRMNIDWNEYPKLAGRYNVLVDAAYKIKT